MGTHARAYALVRSPSWTLAIMAGLAGCHDKGGEISSGQFLAPVSEGAGSTTVLADNKTFLTAIRPDSSTEDLENLRPDSFVLGRPSTHDLQAGSKVERLDEYLIYESRTRSVLSATRCGDAPAAGCSKVTLHYDGRGFDEALEGRLGAAISPNVEPVELRNGWILAFDSGNIGIVAFRKESPRDVNGSQVIYRPFETTLSRNFGGGNGLLVSVVVGAEEIANKVKTVSLSHMLEIEAGKVLLFFTSTADVHLLELREEERLLPFDLDLSSDASQCDPQTDELCLPVKLLKGTIKLFPETGNPDGRPFITESQVVDAVGTALPPNIGLFQPLCMDACEEPGDEGLLVCDRVLLYEEVTLTFLELKITRSADEITGGTLQRWTNTADLLGAIGEANDQTGSGPLRFNSGFCNPTSAEISLFEENSNALVLLDTLAAGDNVRPLFGREDILFRRDPSGKPRQIVAPAEPQLVFSGRDTRDNRLFFEQGAKELQSLNFGTGVVVLVARPEDINAAIGASGNFVFLDPNPLQDQNIRVFDQQTNSLINLRVRYSTLPVRIE